MKMYFGSSGEGDGWPQVDMEWIDPSRWGKVAPTGVAEQSHPKIYWVPQSLEATQSGQNITMLGALGIPCLAVFSGSDPPLLKGEATYNQWAFEVCSLWSQYQEGVLWEAARKAEGEHDQVKYNTSCASKAGMVSEVSTDQARSDDQDTKAPTWEPWPKWVELQQQLLKGLKVH